MPAPTGLCKTMSWNFLLFEPDRKWLHWPPFRQELFMGFKLFWDYVGRIAIIPEL